MKINLNEQTLHILAECKVEGNVVYLPPRQLSRPEYTAVNKVLEAMGGKWNRKAGGHVFNTEPDLDAVILAGEVTDKKKDFQFFPTPPEVAKTLCDMADLTPDSRVLEPSCGEGAIADAVYERGVKLLKGVELNPDMEPALRGKPYTTMVGVDFLQAAPELKKEGYNRIVMNPPFSKQQDITHILAAYDVLAPGGVLVSVCSESAFFRADKKATMFQTFLSEHSAAVVPLEEGAFKQSGTMVRTRIVALRKPA